MTRKNFGDKKIKIRKLEKNDLKIAAKFQNFINSLIAEDAKISMNKKINLKGEREFLADAIKSVKNKKRVFIVAECGNEIAGTASVNQLAWRSNHVGEFGITIRSGYRGLGLGKFMMQEIIKLAKKDLLPKPKMIRLLVYVNNKPAINLYKKLGFKIVAKLPKQLQWKGSLMSEFMMIREI